jgi:pyruvate dehydrogenase E2 component (dihydrolipoamide acetyltransferase)
MVREFELPDVGEGLTEAEIVAWLVEPGESVSEDQPVAEVETDKAVVEVPSPVNGTVREILVEAGEMVPVGTVIITFDDDADGADTEASSPGRADTEASSPGRADTEADADAAGTGDRTFASPTTRRRARELGVDIGTVEGSGPGGRITDADVRAAAEAESTGETATAEAASTTEKATTAESPGGTEGTPSDAGPTSATRRVDDGASRAADTASGGDGERGDAVTDAPAAADRDRTLAAPATRRHAAEAGVDVDAVPTDRTRDGEAFLTPAEVDAYAEAQRRAQRADAETVPAGEADERPSAADGQATGADERIPYRGVRRTIGEQMERSKYTAPHVTHHDEADVTELVETRDRLGERAAERGSRLSYLPFVIKAVVAGLEEYPTLNSRLDEEAEEIVLRGEYHVGIATATDAGLMVPVLRDVDRKGLLGIADEMNDLVERARDRSIAPEEMRGGTFSVTNFGAIGGEYATPIINYPETAILGLGAIKEKPRVVSGEVVPRKVMTLSLSIDHRVVDGAEAARFTNTVIEYLESPELLLLE